ncbi:hypothetical protein FNV43_RR07359 [Rhamnella rubrinervis]|uniref:Uncharacterized protein n=1 Tax=Rhamnella rubrinervis TaxID=2594499 RepID=A0A8K0MMB8_9ROSA|nr:hypothetical protein FNV43_RR07359 [Rhamnella rubrinervis]
MGLMPECNNILSSIQHQVPPLDIEREIANVRPKRHDLLPITRLRVGGRSYITQGALDQVLAAKHAFRHRPYGQNLQFGSFVGASGQQDMSKIICHARSMPCHMMEKSCKRWNANSHRQSDITHLTAHLVMPTK